MSQRTPRVVRRASLGPLEADEPHRVVKPAPPSSPPALDAFTLLGLWRRFRMIGDYGNATRILTELEKLAERPPHTDGEHDEQYD